MAKLTPPLGWNTWNTFGKDINEELILRSADIICSDGYKDCGYEYIVIDDCWSLKERDKNGRLVPDPDKFPHGMKFVADYVHSKGLKFGMYSCAGYQTCADFPGSFEHEWVDAETFAEWGVDYLKYDFCYAPNHMPADLLYKRMGLALKNSGRDIVFSACNWGVKYPRQWVKSTGADCWRSTGDIHDNWRSIKDIALSQIPFLEYNGVGCFNDMDMLVVGMNGKGLVGLGGCNEDEYKTHFSLWSLIGSPLMIGCDIRNVDDKAKKILLNKNAIKINQDPAGRQPFIVNMYDYIPNEARTYDTPFYKEHNYGKEIPIIAKFLDDGTVALGIFNFSDNEAGGQLTAVALDMLGLPKISDKSFIFTDVWTGEEIKPTNEMLLTANLKPHACHLLIGKVVDSFDL